MSLSLNQSYNDVFFDMMRKNFKSHALIYVRVSTDEQAKYGYSLDMQKDQCKQFLEREGYILDDIFIDDGYTAKNMNRPALKKMLEYIKINYKKIGALIVWRLDRLCRNTDDYHATLTREFQARNIRLLSATEINDIDTPFGRYIRNTQINNAELESNLTSIRTIANLREKAKQGSFPGAHVPIGYIRIGKDRNKQIVPDPDTAPFVKYVFDLYSSGLFSYASLARKLREENWMPKGKVVTKKLIENILVNNLLFYTGKFVFSGITYDGKHEPLITNEQYLAIQKERAGHSGEKKQRHSFLYRGLITCPHSGRMLTGEVQKGVNKSGNYIYYRCHRPCKDCEACKNCKRIIKQEVIDEAVKNTICSIAITPQQYQEIKEEAKLILNYQEKFDSNKKKHIEKEVERLNRRLNQLYEDKLDELITPSEYKIRKQKYEMQLDEKTIELSAINKTNVELINNLERVFELLQNLWTRYLEKNEFEKRHLLKILCSNFFYDGSKVVITIKSAFSALFKFAIFENGAGDRSKFELLNGKYLFENFENNIKPLFQNTEFCLLLGEIERFAS